MKKNKKSKRILIDFDGVIHSYVSGWKGINRIPDKPNKGALNWLGECLDNYEVYIFSSRCKDSSGINAMMRWFNKFHFGRLEELKFTYTKIPCHALIDDRAINFRGIFPTIKYLNIFMDGKKR